MSQKAKHYSVVLAYFDANYARRPDSSRSTTGYAIFMGSTLRETKTVSKSFMEEEH